MNFCIFRVNEKKYKTIAQLRGYQQHMERQQETPNANLSIKNQILIGTSNVVTDVEKYIEGIKLRSNAVIARDLLLTCSPQWLEESSEDLKQEWINKNVEWLKQEFGDNITYCVAHNDEKSLHLSALLVPKFQDEKKGYILANRRYFNGAKALSEWQDKYAAAMEGFGLNRGIKWSKSSHTSIRTFYTLVNKELSTSDIKQLCAKAKNSELLESRVQQLEETLKTYKGFNQKTEEEKAEIRKQNIVLFKEVKELQADKELYKDVIKTLSDAHGISKTHLDKVLKYVVEKSNSNDKQLERSK